MFKRLVRRRIPPAAARLFCLVLAWFALWGLSGCGGGGMAPGGSASEGPRAGSGNGSVSFTLDFRANPGRAEALLTSVDLSQTATVLLDIQDPQTRALRHPQTVAQRQPGVERQTVVVRDVMPGTHLLRLRLQDGAGADLMVDEEVATIAVGQTTTVTFDMAGTDQPPTVAITAPTAGQIVSGNVTIAVTAQDDKAVTQVEFFLNGVTLGTDLTAPYGKDWDTTTVQDGAHRLEAVARDTAGQTTTTGEIPVNVFNFVDNPPTVNLTAPAEGGPPVFGTLTIQATASDDVRVTQVQFFVDTTSLGTDTAAPYEQVWDSNGVSNGPHTLRAVARDNAGQTATDEVPITVSNLVDNPPTVNFVFPTDGLGVGGSLTLVATASDDVSVAQVEFFVESSSLGADTVAPYERDWDTTTVPDGSYTLRAEATDNIGQMQFDEVTVNVSNPPYDTLLLSNPLVGVDGNGSSTRPPGPTSADGRFHSFESTSSNLVPSDTNGAYDVFVRDAQAANPERVSVVNGTGAQANGSSVRGGLSADGRYVAFSSSATNLVLGDANGRSDVFLRDRLAGTTEIVSLASDETQSNGNATMGGVNNTAGVSADGRYVVFENTGSNLAGTDTNGVRDVFVRDRLAGTTELVSVNTGGAQSGNGESFWATLSSDGRYVAFESSASNLVAGDTNGVSDCFLRDRVLGTTVRVSLDSGGAQGNARTVRPYLSADGVFVAFLSEASNLVAGDTNGTADVFVRNRVTLETSRASVATGGGQSVGAGIYPTGNPNYLIACSVSGDGRYVAFDSTAPDLVAGDTNGVIDAFVHDLLTHQTVRVSVASDGAQGDKDSGLPVLSGDGRYVVIESQARNFSTPNQSGFVPDAFRVRNVLAP